MIEDRQKESGPKHVSHHDFKDPEDFSLRSPRHKINQELGEDHMKLVFKKYGLDYDSFDDGQIAERTKQLLQVFEEDASHDFDFDVERKRILLAYATFYPEEFAKGISNLIELNGDSNIALTKRAIEVVGSIYRDLFMYESERLNVEDYKGDLKNKDPDAFNRVTSSTLELRKSIEKLLEARKGNFILNLRLKALLSSLEEPYSPVAKHEEDYRNWASGDRGEATKEQMVERLLQLRSEDPQVFRLSRDHFAKFTHSGLEISKPDRIEEVEPYLKREKKEEKLRVQEMFSNWDVPIVLDSTEEEEESLASPKQPEFSHQPQRADGWESLSEKLDHSKLSYQTKTKEGQEINQKELLDDYLYLISSEVRTEVENEFNIKLTDLSLREQYYFLTFLSQKSIDDSERIAEFCGVYGTSGLRTFLSLEHDQVNGDAVVDGLLKLDHNTGQSVVEKYVAIMNASERATEMVKAKPSLSEEVEHNTRERAAKFLVRFAEGVDDDLGTLKEKLSKVEADTELLVATTRTLFQQGEAIDLVEGVRVSTQSSAELAEDPRDIKRIESLLIRTYKDKTKEFQDSVIESFRNATSTHESKFYVLRYKEEIAALLRFDQHQAGEKYFGSFVSDPAFENGKVGEALMINAMSTEARDSIILAHCNPLSSITQKYIETGFVATKLEDYAGVPSFSIRLDAKANTQSETKSWKPERIVQAALSQNNPNIQAFSVKRSEEIPFNLVNQGFSLTRYLKQGERLYAVFERLSSEEKGSA